MPVFSRDVPTDPRGPAFPILRTPAARPITAIITSPDLVGCFTHYFKGRTVPCEGAGCRLCLQGKTPTQGKSGKPVHVVNKIEIPCDGPPCDACHAGMPYRWHAYQSAFTTVEHLHCLFECTAQAAEVFTDYREAHGTLRGCLFQASRLHNKPNGRIIIQTKPADLTGVTLPKPPDIIKCLSILWGFSSDQVHAGTINPEKKTRNVTHNPLKDPAP